MSFFEGAVTRSRVVRKPVFFVVALFLLQLNVQVSHAPAYENCDTAKIIIDHSSPFASAIAEQKALESIQRAKEIAAEKLSRTPGARYHKIIRKIANKYGVDPLLVRAVIVAESNYNEKAVSRVGAVGLMQLMPITAKEMGVEDSFNPEHNINGGVKYLKRLLDRYQGNVEYALAAYNAGSRNVRRYKGIPPYAETRNYIKKVCSLRDKFKKSEILLLAETGLTQI